MSYTKHNTLIITSRSSPEAQERFTSAHDKALQLFGHLVSNIVKSDYNGTQTFMVAPDDSKNDYKESDEFDIKRQEFCDHMDALAYDDGSNQLFFSDISHDEQHIVKIERSNNLIGTIYDDSHETNNN